MKTIVDQRQGLDKLDYKFKLKNIGFENIKLYVFFKGDWHDFFLAPDNFYKRFFGAKKKDLDQNKVGDFARQLTLKMFNKSIK